MLKWFFTAVILVFNSLLANSQSTILPGAYSTSEYFSLLKNKNVAVVANHTSLINETHLVDTLLSSGIKVVRIFCPEHGFRGHNSAGEKINNGVDVKTGLPIISLYGKHKKPYKSDLNGIDVIVFDLQDVGVRFYTYISTLQLVAEACAEYGKELIVLDRPNPNGFYVYGPVLDTNFRSFIGMQPVPVVYGMTIGEYIKMLKGERWFKYAERLNLKVIKCRNYTHNSLYKLPVNPSPNLKDMKAVYLYPSLCFLEGTKISVGRGTDKPFRIYGAPFFPDSLPYRFKPVSMQGAKHPKFEGQWCYGYNVSEEYKKVITNKSLVLDWLLNAYKLTPDSLKQKFFRSSFDKLAGTDKLRRQIIAGKSADEIRKSWQSDIENFLKIRKKYLLYE
jgi:uncharacterized protein YbbC (DUF1343 family)